MTHLMTYLPQYFKVGPIRYNVKRHKSVDFTNRWGETDHNQAEIRFGSLISGERLSITCLHEVMHAVWYVYGVDGLLDDPAEEKVIAAMALGLAQVLQDAGMWPREMGIVEPPATIGD